MKKLINILILLFCGFAAFAQSEAQPEATDKRIVMHFALDVYDLDEEFGDNAEAFRNFTEFFTSLKNNKHITVTGVRINSFASPEGGRQYNDVITKNRTNSIYQYITESGVVDPELITSAHSGIDWVGLRKAVAASNMAYRDVILDIIDNEPEETWEYVRPTDRWLTMTTSRNKKLMDLRYGKPYMYMMDEIFPNLRRGSVVVSYVRSAESIAFAGELPVNRVENLCRDTTSESVPEVSVEPVVDVESYVKKPLFALKTNLLFDVATLANVELEVPIGKRWSIAGEWIFPWWTWDDGTSTSSRNRIQLLNANLEAKYWFGDRTDRQVLTGWFAGFYAGGGLYDFERNAKGYQGEFFIAAGLGGGYAHTINKSGTLRMEYSLGLGYLKTNYRYYEAQYDIDNKWHPVRQKTGNYTWFGPTQAKVSLVWLINYNSKKGGKL